MLIFASQYGGLFAPVFTSYFIDQNDLIVDGEHEVANATVLNMATVGVVNGLVDMESMALGFPDWAMNNTYGLPAYDEETYLTALDTFTAPEIGCLDQVQACRKIANESDPDGYATNEEVNEVCGNATEVCFGGIMTTWETSPVSELSAGNSRDEEDHLTDRVIHDTVLPFRHYAEYSHRPSLRIRDRAFQPAMGASRARCSQEFHQGSCRHRLSIHSYR